jgi:hypothetical protein
MRGPKRGVIGAMEFRIDADGNIQFNDLVRAAYEFVQGLRRRARG